MQDLKVSIIQTSLFWENKEQNLKLITQQIEAIKSKPDLIVLPEMFNTGFSMLPKKLAEPEIGPTLKWMQIMAAQSGAAIAGSLMVFDQNNYYNRLYFVEPDGSFQSYDKRHLFRMGNEDHHFSPGNKKLIVNYKNWKINFLICYDLRFPVWSKNNYLNQHYDYDLLVVVANWPAVRSHIWEALIRARAIENQAFVVAVNRIGNDGNELAHSGNSNIVDPKGNFLIQNSHNNEMVDTVVLNYNELEDFRNKFKVGLDWDYFSIDYSTNPPQSNDEFNDKQVQKDYNG